MNRRDFVARLSGSMAAGGAVAATVAAASRDKAQDGLQYVNQELKALNERIDNIDESHKKMFRALIMVASVSTGIDALTLLKGDIWS